MNLYGHESYTDVTDKLKARAANLKVGELVNSDDFSLFRVVHALELGSDKMDTGLVYRPLQEELVQAPKIDTPEAVVQLIDALVRREMSWHSGFALMQNVLSCVYVEEILNAHDGATNEDEDLVTDSWGGVLKVYILGLIKSIDLAQRLMHSTTALVQEEDIVLNSAGFTLLGGVQKDKIVSGLKKALTWVKQQNTTTPEIKHRIELRILFLHILADGVPKMPAHVLNAKKLLRNITSTDQEPDKVFSTGIQSRVANTSPLRPLVSEPQGYKVLEQIITGFENLMPVLQQVSSSNDLLSFYLKFSASRPRPLPIVRAALGSTITMTTVLGKSMKSWVQRDMIELTCAAYESVLADPQLKEPIDMFQEQASLCYGDLVTSMCQNRSRQRQSLSHCIVSFDSLQVSAEQLEQELAKVGVRDTMVVDRQRTDALPISSWVYLRKLNIMIWVVLLGFELDIYGLWEYPRMYYYCQFLLSALNNHLARTQIYLQQRRNTTNALNYIKALSVESGMLEQLCQSAMYLAIAFDKFKLLTDAPKSPVTSPELMYNLRMKPFSSVGMPEMPSYEEFKQAMSKFKNAKDAAAMAKAAANSCKKAFTGFGTTGEANNEVDMLKRSSIGIYVTASMLEKQKAVPKLERENYHWFFPVLSLSGGSAA